MQQLASAIGTMSNARGALGSSMEQPACSGVRSCRALVDAYEQAYLVLLETGLQRRLLRCSSHIACMDIREL